MFILRQENDRDANVVFLQNHGIFFAAKTVTGLDEIVADVSDRVNAGIREAFGLDEAQADRLFRQMLIYANGLAVFLNSGIGQLSETEISRAIGEVCLSLVARYRILDGSLDPEAMRGMLAMPERMPERGATA